MVEMFRQVFLDDPPHIVQFQEPACGWFLPGRVRSTSSSSCRGPPRSSAEAFTDEVLAYAEALTRRAFATARLLEPDRPGT
jgi:hypothetical protein